MLSVLLFGRIAASTPSALAALRDTVSADPDWRVQEMLARAFDQYCKDVGYTAPLSTITDWLVDDRANVRRAVSEGLRIWTSRPYFKAHPEQALALLSARRADASAYVRKSVGNAIRDISRKHAALVRAELETWDLAVPPIAFTYKLASRFL